jgi:hypothetical protein
MEDIGPIYLRAVGQLDRYSQLAGLETQLAKLRGGQIGWPRGATIDVSERNYVRALGKGGCEIDDIGFVASLTPTNDMGIQRDAERAVSR